MYRGEYYKMASKTELDKFLASPDNYVLPNAPQPLPSTDLLPQKKTYAAVKALFPKQIELQCFCPVAYVEGKYRYVISHMNLSLNTVLCLQDIPSVT